MSESITGFMNSLGTIPSVKRADLVPCCLGFLRFLPRLPGILNGLSPVR